MLRVGNFCFCKQRTAYEMRISDGGSEVCSSDLHVLSRWPGTGPRHAPHCDHYEAPDHLTGLGQVLGSAIVDDIDNGVTTLKFGFPLSKGPARAAPASFTNDKPDVKATGQRLSMRGMRTEEHTSELQSLMRISYAVFCLKKQIIKS